MLELLAKVFTSRITWVVLAIAGGMLGMSIIEGRAYDRGINDERSRQATAQLAAVYKIRKQYEVELRERGWLDVAAAATARAAQKDLSERLAELASLPPRTLIKTVVKKDESGCSHPDPSLGDDFWVRYRAAGDRGTPDPTAASGMPGEVR